MPSVIGLNLTPDFNSKQQHCMLAPFYKSHNQIARKPKQDLLFPKPKKRIDYLAADERG